MKLAKTLSLAALIACGVAAPAYADRQGDIGRIAAFRVVEPSSDQYATARGFLYLTNAEFTSVKYQWGGQSCNGRNLSDQSIDVLIETVAREGVEVQPFYKLGGGGVRCLVGYQISDPSLALQ